MRKLITFLCLIGMIGSTHGQITPFEKSGGTETATYAEIMPFYTAVDQQSKQVLMKTMGTTDNGYPLHLVLVSADGRFDPAEWHRQKKVVILVNNGIHPGEPDGIDASMLLVRDIANGKYVLPKQVVLAIVPVYNIAGCLNRGSFSRVNQNGPASYGFRGNAQNLDLNRDFIKCDSKDAQSFTRLFHWLDPEILIDNHVSDGADYQYTMTLITSQYEKLGPVLGPWVKSQFEPAIYRSMQQKHWEMSPYVNFETTDFGKGMEMFYDPPRYSSGYAALFQTIGFVPETHMLKMFKDRVTATYQLMTSFIETSAARATDLIEHRQRARKALLEAEELPLRYELDRKAFDTLLFKGYAVQQITSEATGLPRLRYDQKKTFEKTIRYFNRFNATDSVKIPKAYIIPAGWHEVIVRLKLNKVNLRPLEKDTVLEVTVDRIESYQSYKKPYEKHHKNYDVKISSSQQKITFHKGDWYIPIQQPAKRYLIESLSPQGEDGFFAWNFFDAILQQKEGYSDYRWEDLAAAYLKSNPELQQALLDKKKADPQFNSNSGAQLEFIYQHSPYYEPEHLRVPVFRLF